MEAAGGAPGPSAPLALPCRVSCYKQSLPGDAPTVLTLDAGSSSVRTVLFDAKGRRVDGFGTQIPYALDTTPDGLVDLCVKALSAACVQLRHANMRPGAVACDTFWHSILGVDSGGRPATPMRHLLDTRSEEAAPILRQRVDYGAQHAL